MITAGQIRKALRGAPNSQPIRAIIVAAPENDIDVEFDKITQRQFRNGTQITIHVRVRDSVMRDEEAE